MKSQSGFCLVKKKKDEGQEEGRKKESTILISTYHEEDIANKETVKQNQEIKCKTKIYVIFNLGNSIGNILIHDFLCFLNFKLDQK